MTRRFTNFVNDIFKFVKIKMVQDFLKFPVKKVNNNFYEQKFKFFFMDSFMDSKQNT